MKIKNYFYGKAKDVAGASRRTPRQPSAGGEDAGAGGAAEWRASYCLCNNYRSFEDVVGAHSDHLTHIGKRPTIASLSLGATRRLRLTRRRCAPGPAERAGPPAAAPVSVCDIYQPYVLAPPPSGNCIAPRAPACREPDRIGSRG